MQPARILIGLALALLPAAAFAQESSSGATTVTIDSGSLLLGRLESMAQGALPLADVAMTPKERETWATDVKRYAERSAELRSRCHKEIRKANRDTIAAKAAQCLRSDLLLEATHRRKQRDLFVNTDGVQQAVIGGATTGIDAWLDASTTIIDGIDAGVFTTVDALKTAKKNLHATYRAPMQQAFVRVRIDHGVAILRSTAAAVLESLNGETHTVLATFVPCMEAARAAFDSEGGLTAGMSQLRGCITIIEDEA